MGDHFVVDNSVVMAWCFADEENDYADLVLGSLEDNVAIVPAIWPLEIGNILVVAERRKRLSEADGVRFLSLVKNLPISVEQETPNRMMKEILAIARHHQLSTYNASYLDLAMRRDLALATQDVALRRAAKRCQVPIFEKFGTQ